MAFDEGQVKKRFRENCKSKKKNYLQFSGNFFLFLQFWENYFFIFGIFAESFFF